MAVTGLVLALVGQHLIAHRIDLRWGAVLLALGAGSFAAACWGIHRDAKAPAAPVGPSLSTWLIALAPAAFVCIAGLVLFVVRGPSTLPWLVWGASVVLAAGLGWRAA
ncbi:MAG: hypothetical protein M3O34_15420, partial [Chloroflexota bacterium]|nr:hypothetical protein [Chloroflexota bacterium]